MISKNLFGSSQENHMKLKQFFISYDSSDIFPDPKNINSKKKNLIIFDDPMTNKNQDITGNFYTRGGHNNCLWIYVSQNYHRIRRQTMRTNCNSLILFEIPKNIWNISMMIKFKMTCVGMS